MTYTTSSYNNQPFLKRSLLLNKLESSVNLVLQVALTSSKFELRITADVFFSYAGELPSSSRMALVVRLAIWNYSTMLGQSITIHGYLRCDSHHQIHFKHFKPSAGVITGWNKERLILAWK